MQYCGSSAGYRLYCTYARSLVDARTLAYTHARLATHARLRMLDLLATVLSAHANYRLLSLARSLTLDYLLAESCTLATSRYLSLSLAGARSRSRSPACHSQTHSAETSLDDLPTLHPPPYYHHHDQPLHIETMAVHHLPHHKCLQF